MTIQYSHYKSLREYIKYYNGIRRHFSLGILNYKTPSKMFSTMKTAKSGPRTLTGSRQNKRLEDTIFTYTIENLFKTGTGILYHVSVTQR